MNFEGGGGIPGFREKGLRLGERKGREGRGRGQEEERQGFVLGFGVEEIRLQG